ncbi:hypothetical protein [Enterococcus sp. DIV0800]|uniref:hypothetical protein n=1 Tax=unclassified Enterococcus TaxID=2608891 RepID=UPI003D30172B
MLVEKMEKYGLHYSEYDFLKEELNRLEENYYNQKVEYVDLFLEAFAPVRLEDAEADEDQEAANEIVDRMERAKSVLDQLERYESAYEWYNAYDDDIEGFKEDYERMEGDATEEDIDRLKEKISNFESQIQKVVELLDQITDLNFEIVTIDCSFKTISTYLKLKAADYERFADVFSGDGDFSYYENLSKEDSSDDMKNNNNLFKIRISDHEPGGFTSEYDLSYIKYDDDQVQFII